MKKVNDVNTVTNAESFLTLESENGWVNKGNFIYSFFHLIVNEIRLAGGSTIPISWNFSVQEKKIANFILIII